MKHLYTLLILFLPVTGFAQVVTGMVNDVQSKPLYGITVSEKGSHQATVTDDKGHFKIRTITLKPVLIFSAANLQTEEVEVGRQTELKIILLQKTTSLDEVHVIAYGTSTQRNSVGSITKITSAEIQQQPVTNPLAALEGRVAGLSIVASSGLPGSSFSVQVRGQNTLNANLGSLANRDQPLFIVDGVPFAPQNDNVNQFRSAISPGNGTFYGNAYGGVSPFNSINPSDIESIEVLKDADATAIYGSRGGNGVILITTKKGKAGKTNFDLTLDNGISSVGKTMPMMNTEQYLSMRREAFSNDKLVPNNVLNSDAYAPDLTVFDQTRQTDWKKFFLGNTAHHFNTSTALSGGNEHTQFRLAGGFNRDTYIFPGDYKNDRVSFSSNIHDMTEDKKFTVDLTTTYSYSNNNTSPSADLLTAFTLTPNYPEPQDSNGNLIWNYKGAGLDGSYAAVNPFTSFKRAYTIDNTSLNTNLLLSYQLFKGMTLRTSTGFGSFESNEFSSFPLASQNPVYNPTAKADFGKLTIKTWIVEPQLEYKNSYKKGLYSLLLGGTFQRNSNYSTQIEGIGYINDDLLGSVSGSAAQTASDAYSLYKYAAVFARFNFRWNSKYLLDINGRRDGSSRFGPDKRFGNFGSVGAGWIFSEESFLKAKIPALSYGKLRGSYGITGSDAIGDYNFISRYAPTPYNYGGTLGYLPQNLANDQFGWASNRKLEFGLELGFFEDRLLLNTAWYRNRAGNQLIQYALPDQTGFANVVENSPALVENTGWEFSLQGKLLTHKDFSWSTSFNLTIPRNLLLAFHSLSTSSYATTYVIGKSTGEILGFRSAGVNPETGLFQFYDANGSIVSNPKPPSGNNLNDFYDIGNRDPKFYGGLLNNFSVRNFQLTIFTEFRKQRGINYLGQLYGTPGGITNQPAALIDAHWNGPGDNASFQKYAAVYGDAAIAQANYLRSDGIYSDASYIRLKTVSLSYFIPAKILSKINAKSLRLYINAQNLFTITGYKGNDPATQNFYGIPTLRVITGGLQLNY